MDTIFMTASGGFGDILCSTCLLPYREELWPGKRLAWFVHPDCKDILEFNDKVDEVRIVSDLVSAYDPQTTITINTAPWWNGKLIGQGIPYALIPMRVVGREFKDWHPYIKFSKEEDERSDVFIKSLPFPKTVILETVCRSGQGSWNSQVTAETFRICRDIIGPCNFLFASKTGFDGNTKQSLGFEGDGVADLSAFTIRQCVPIFNRCHLMVGISSGLSCAVCSWQANPAVERVELVHNKQYGTWPMARGPLATTTTAQELFAAITAAAERIKSQG